METLTETIITDSSMIGHNPSTPAGAGQAVGEILLIENLSRGIPGTQYIVAAPQSFSYEEVAAILNQAADTLDIVGVILQADEAFSHLFSGEPDSFSAHLYIYFC